MGTTPRFAGDIDINLVNIISTKDQVHTITHQVMAFEIYEDIFSPFISGNITVRDSQELSSLLPLVGEEIIVFNIATPGGEEFKKIFSIYKMGERTQLSKDNVNFRLYFMSKEAIIDQNRKISKGFYGDIAKSSGDCIVRKMIEDPLALNNVNKKEVFIENSSSQTRYVSNFWSPVQNLNYLTELAVSEASNPSPTYVFFENRKGFHFVTIGALYENKYGDSNISEFIWEKIPPDEFDIEANYKHIIDFDTPQTFDYMKRLQGGMYGTEIVSYDILTKQYAHVGNQLEFGKGSHLNEFRPKSKEPPAQMRSQMLQVPTYFNNYDDYRDVSSFKNLQNRMSLMATAESFKLNIVVSGKLEYTVGQVVKVKFPLNTQMNEQLKSTQDMEDKVYSGSYVIAALCHKVDRKRHVCTMEIIKDTYKVDIESTFYDP